MLLPRLTFSRSATAITPRLAPVVVGESEIIRLLPSSYLLTPPNIENAVVIASPAAHADWDAMLAAYPSKRMFLLAPGDYNGWGVIDFVNQAGGVEGAPKVIRYFNPADGFIHPTQRENHALIAGINFEGSTHDWYLHGLTMIDPLVPVQFQSGVVRCVVDWFVLQGDTHAQYGVRIRESEDCCVQRGLIADPPFTPGVDSIGVQIGNSPIVVGALVLDLEIRDYGDSVQPSDLSSDPTADIGYIIDGVCGYVTEARYLSGGLASSENGVDFKVGSDTERSRLSGSRLWGFRRTSPATSTGDAIVIHKYARNLDIVDLIVDDCPAGIQESNYPIGADQDVPRDIVVERVGFRRIRNISGDDSGACIQPVNNTEFIDIVCAESDYVVRRTVAVYRGGGPTFDGGKRINTGLESPDSVAASGYTEPPNEVAAVSPGYAFYERRRWTGFDVATDDSAFELALSPFLNDDPLLSNYSLVRPPVAAFSLEITAGVAQITDESSAPDGTIVSYDYDWGDGSAHDTDPEPDHLYSLSGIYSITQTVTDSNGLVTKTIRQFEVTLTRANITMAIVGANSTTTDAATFDSASITPVSGRTYYHAIASTFGGGTPNQPTASGAHGGGNGMAWTLVRTQTQGSRRLTVFQAVADGSAVAGTTRFDFGGQTQESMISHCVEAADAEVTGPTEQSVVKADTGVTAADVELPAPLEDAAHNVMLVFLMLTSNTAVTPDPQFTEPATPFVGDTGIGTLVMRLETEWAQGETRCQPTFSSTAYGAVGIEIRAGVV